MAQNSKRNWIRGKNESNFEPLQYFRAKKSEPLRPKDMWSGFRGKNKRNMNCSNFEPLQNQMQMLARDIVSIDDFLSHLNIPPVIWSTFPYYINHMVILYMFNYHNKWSILYDHDIWSILYGHNMWSKLYGPHYMDQYYMDQISVDLEN